MVNVLMKLNIYKAFKIFKNRESKSTANFHVGLQF